MKLTIRRFDLKLAHRWMIASGLGPGGGGGTDDFKIVVVQLSDEQGLTGLGEAAPSTRYAEDAESVVAFLQQINAAQLSFNDLEGSMAYLNQIAPENSAPKGAINMALLDGAARAKGQPIYDFLHLGFQENKHITSFSIGIDKPERIREKVLAAAEYPILKLKVGSPDDRQNFAALRDIAPRQTVRVDANEAWKTKEEALRHIEWLAADGHVEFIEQPMPSLTDPKDLIWLKARSPLPLMADEACTALGDVSHCAECYHAVNVKLVKAGGISNAHDILCAARRLGLKTMIGCMIESSILITAAAHLAELTDYLDIDGNLLVTNDPYRGVTSERGLISFRSAPEPLGLRVTAR